MPEKDPTHQRTPREEIVDVVATWPHVTTAAGRFNSTRFMLAGNEFGHIHPTLADIGFPKPLRDQLIAEGHTQEHHVVPRHPNATTFRMGSAGDVGHAIWLFRLSYLARLATLDADGDMEPALDIEAELDELAPSAPVRAAFETAVAA